MSVNRQLVDYYEKNRLSDEFDEVTNEVYDIINLFDDYSDSVYVQSYNMSNVNVENLDEIFGLLQELQKIERLADKAIEQEDSKKFLNSLIDLMYVMDSYGYNIRDRYFSEFFIL